MKTDRFDGSLRVLRWRALLLAAMLCGVFAGTGAGAKTPKQYKDVGGLQPSQGCTDHFHGNVYLPTSTSKRGHAYVLLLIFDTKEHADDAGQSLFYADPPPADGKPGTWSCLEDSDYAQTVYGRSVQGWGVVAKGGCPKDCAVKDVQIMNALQPALTQETQITDEDKDPLSYMKGCPRWAIFAADDDDKKKKDDKKEEAHVWQIRAADRVHAQELLAFLKQYKRLEDTAGYKGHILIGYKPGWAWPFLKCPPT